MTSGGRSNILVTVPLPKRRLDKSHAGLLRVVAAGEYARNKFDPGPCEVVYLNLSTFIAAPPEEVYAEVAVFDRRGPINEEAFRAKYGTVVSREGDIFVTREQLGEEQEPITWRCTFQYPAQRTMEAVDSLWAHRVDRFRPVNGGTRWTIRWDTRIGGLRGLAQYVFFRMAGHRRIRRRIVDEVVERLQQGEGRPE